MRRVVDLTQEDEIVWYLVLSLTDHVLTDEHLQSLLTLKIKISHVDHGIDDPELNGEIFSEVVDIGFGLAEFIWLVFWISTLIDVENDTLTFHLSFQVFYR